MGKATISARIDWNQYEIMQGANLAPFTGTNRSKNERSKYYCIGNNATLLKREAIRLKLATVDELVTHYTDNIKVGLVRCSGWRLLILLGFAFISRLWAREAKTTLTAIISTKQGRKIGFATITAFGSDLFKLKTECRNIESQVIKYPTVDDHPKYPQFLDVE